MYHKYTQLNSISRRCCSSGTAVAGERQNRSVSQFFSHSSTGSLRGTHPNHIQWTLAALSQAHHLPSNKCHYYRTCLKGRGGEGGRGGCCCSVIPHSHCPLHSPFFSFSRSLPVSLSPSFCPLLCKRCNFSLQWENRYNRGRAPVCLIKE